MAAQVAHKEVKSVSFRDIDDSYAKDAIVNLQRAGIVDGEGAGEFFPKRVITRAEASKFIVLALGLEQDQTSVQAFKDVPKDSWYAGFVGALVKAGIIQGTSATTFSPQDQVTREQLAVLFIRALGLHTQSVNEKDYKAISDWSSVTEWAKSSIQIALHIGFIKGIDNGNGTIRFEPKEAAERQAIALLTNEMMTNKSTYLKWVKGSAEESKPGTDDKGTTIPPTMNSNGINNGGSGSVGGSGSGGSGGGGSNGGSTGNNGESPKIASLTPVVTEEIYNVAGTQVTGSAEKNTTVSIRHQGKVIAEQKSNANGEFTIDIPNIHMFSISGGDTIEITAKADGKEVSAPLQKTVKQGRKPSGAKIYGYIDEDGGIIGTSKIAATLQDMIVVKQDGSFIECKESRGVEDGACALAIDNSLAPHETLKVYAMFNGLSVSDPTEIEVEPVKGETEFTVVTAAVYDGLSYVDIRAPKYTQFTVRDSKFQVLEINVKKEAYKKSVRLSLDGHHLQPGDNVYVFANGHKKKISEAYPITIQSAERVSIPTVTGDVYSGGGVISGKSEPDAIVEIHTEKGELIKTVKTDNQGNFAAGFQIIDPLSPLERLTVTIKKIGKKESIPVYIIAKPITGKTEPPKKLPNQMKEASNLIFGIADPYSSIKFKKTDGTLLWTLYSEESGAFSGRIPIKGQKEIIVTANSFGKEESDPVTIKIITSKTTETPIILGDVYDVNPIFTGTTVPGATVVVKSLNGYGEYSTYSSDGTFRIESTQNYQAGDEFGVIARVSDQWSSAPALVTVLPASASKAEAPTVVTAAVYEDGGKLEVMTSQNARVFVKDKFGMVIDSSSGDIMGKFGFSLSEEQVLHNTELFISTRVKGLVDSTQVTVSLLPVQGITPVPTVVGNVYAERSYFYVNTVPNALIVVMDEQGNIIQEERADRLGNVFVVVFTRLEDIKMLTIIADGFGLTPSAPLIVEVLPGRG